MQFKYGGLMLKSTFLNFLNLCWLNCSVLNQKNIAKVISLFKKVNISDKSNHRGVCLLNATYKVFREIINKRLQIISDVTLIIGTIRVITMLQYFHFEVINWEMMWTYFQNAFGICSLSGSFRQGKERFTPHYPWHTGVSQASVDILEFVWLLVNKNLFKKAYVWWYKNYPRVATRV